MMRHLVSPAARRALSRGLTTQPAQKRVLLLGSGLVASPVIDFLCRDKDTFVTVASKDSVTVPHANSRFVKLSVDDCASLTDQISQHDLVISLVPAFLHAGITRKCIALGKNVVTASYVSPEMAALHDEAVAAGVTVLNEVGLDPGIDHLTAKKTIDEVHATGGKIKSFVSWCGGLPAPEASGNALGYKFSWSPRGVLTAGLNTARYLQDGHVVEIKGGELFHATRPVSIYPGFSTEGYPNRDSLPYIDSYGIPETTQMLRGTLRFKGFSSIMISLSRVGYFDVSAYEDLQPGSRARLTWRDLTCRLVGVAEGCASEVLAAEVVAKCGLRDPMEIERVLDSMRSLGLCSDTLVCEKAGTILDATSMLFAQAMAYAPHERDLVLLHHEFGVELANGQREKRTTTLVMYGEPEGYTAMAKTVGIPTAVAARLVMDGTITKPGVIIPVDKAIYEPMLDALEAEGISAVEKTMSQHI